MKIFTLFLALFTVGFLKAQVTPAPIFNDRKVINAFSVETLRKNELDVRISHRFGDIAGENGGWQNFYGLEDASDVSIGVEYGLKDNVLLGLNRSAGQTLEYSRLVNGYIKYRLAGLNPGNPNPTAVAFLAYVAYSTSERSTDASDLNFFPEAQHRFSYHFAGMVAKRFTDGFSGQLQIGYTHRNYVRTGEDNFILSVGGATRFQVNKAMAILLEGTLPIRFDDVDQYTIPTGIGIEWETGGGHVFQWNLTNSGGLSEPDYIGFTTQKWSEGEFRLGFTIARIFNL